MYICMYSVHGTWYKVCVCLCVYVRLTTYDVRVLRCLFAPKYHSYVNINIR